MFVCFLFHSGEAEEATVYFGDAAVHCVQELYIGNASSYLQLNGKDQSLDSSTFGLEDLSLCQLQQMGRNSTKDICQNNHGGPCLAGTAGEINNFCKILDFKTPSPMLTQVSQVYVIKEEAILISSPCNSFKPLTCLIL